jgi:transposase
VIREKCGQARHVLDRFHIVKKLQEAVDEVRSAKPNEWPPTDMNHY